MSKMASPDEQTYEECVTDDHTDEEDEEEVDSDDSDEDPTFGTIDGSRSKLSSLSIKNTSKTRLGKERIDDEEENGEKDSYQIVEDVIKAGQLEKLKVEQCKVYLRKHGLRLTGNKGTLIQRIREHLDVTDGGGEQKYPVSSFVVNCKGDACAGDVVLFEQNVYEMYSIASRSATGPSSGTRLVAGRIVKESYGAEKQQHTFTIEVLWSTGEKPLPPLHQLLIKGRNLYRLKTMRQKWEDESERQKMLSEKHSRGHVARSNRATRVQEKEMRNMMRNLKMEDKTRPAPANIAMNTMDKQPPLRPPENKPSNLQSHIGNAQMERQHHQHQPRGNQHNLQSHIGNVLMERHHQQYQHPGRQMKMEDKEKPTPTNIAMTTMVKEGPLKPPENKPSNLEIHIGNALLERQRHQYHHPGSQHNLQSHTGNVIMERHHQQYHHPGRQMKMEDKKRPTSANIAMTTIVQEGPLKPPVNKPSNLEIHIGNSLLERQHHQYHHPGSQHNLQPHIGNVLMERNHHQYQHQHPGSQPLASMSYNFPRNHLPGNATYGGQNPSSNSFNSVQSASHYGSYGNHNSIGIPSRAPTPSINSIGSNHGCIDAHFRRENPVQGHLQEKKLQACRHFAQGRCHFGDRCKLLHDDSRIPKH